MTIIYAIFIYSLCKKQSCKLIDFVGFQLLVSTYTIFFVFISFISYKIEVFNFYLNLNQIFNLYSVIANLIWALLLWILNRWSSLYNYYYVILSIIFVLPTISNVYTNECINIYFFTALWNTIDITSVILSINAIVLDYC